jgi:hypothetical protein
LQCRCVSEPYGRRWKPGILLLFLARNNDKLQPVRKVLAAIGLLLTTIIVPVLAIVLAVWFIACIVRGSMWPWWFWVASVVFIILLQVLAKLVTRYAVKDE